MEAFFKQFKWITVLKSTSTEPGKSLLGTLTSIKSRFTGEIELYLKSYLRLTWSSELEQALPVFHTMTVIERIIGGGGGGTTVMISETTKLCQYLKTNAYVLLMAILIKALSCYKPSSASLWFSYFEVTGVHHCALTDKSQGQDAGRIFFTLPRGVFFFPSVLYQGTLADVTFHKQGFLSPIK